MKQLFTIAFRLLSSTQVVKGRLKLSLPFFPLVKAIGLSSIGDSDPLPYLAKVIFGTINLSPEVFKESCAVVTGEIQTICSSLSPKILNSEKPKTDLQNFSWYIVYSEF